MNTAHLQPIFDYLNETLLTVVTFLVAYASRYAKAWLASHLDFVNAQTKKQAVDYAEQALEHGIKYAMMQLQNDEAKHEAVTFPGGLQGWAESKAAQYVIDHAGDEVRQLGWTPALITQKIAVRLPAIPTTGASDHVG